MNSNDPDYEVVSDYELFTPSNEMKALTDTNDVRREEETFRPNVEDLA